MQWTRISVSALDWIEGVGLPVTALHQLHSASVVTEIVSSDAIVLLLILSVLVYFVKRSGADFLKQTIGRMFEKLSIVFGYRSWRVVFSQLGQLSSTSSLRVYWKSATNPEYLLTVRSVVHCLENREKLQIGTLEDLLAPFGQSNTDDYVGKFQKRLYESRWKDREEAKSALRSYGFLWLTDRNINNPPKEPETVWQRPLHLSEIDDFALEWIGDEPPNALRNGPLETTFDRVESILKQNHCAVTGPQGCGKSVISRAVALRWHRNEKTGPVLYGDTTYVYGGPSEIPDGEAVSDVLEAIETATEWGPVLLYVEDGGRTKVSRLPEVISSIDADDRVSVLTDIRDVLTDGEAIAPFETAGVTKFQVPTIDVSDVEGFLDLYSSCTDEPVPWSASELIHRLTVTSSGRANRDPRRGQMVLLTEYLHGGGLEENVESVFAEVKSLTANCAAESTSSRDLAQRFAIVVNLLNATDGCVPITDDAIDALAMNGAEREILTSVLEQTKGTLWFNQFSSTKPEGRNQTILTAHHPLWSIRYLLHLLNQPSREYNIKRFQECLETILSSASHPDRVVTNIYDLGERYPELAVLLDVFSTGKDGIISTHCRPETQRSIKFLVGKMYSIQGAQRLELSKTLLTEVADGVQDCQGRGKEVNKIYARSLLELGRVFRRQAKYRAAIRAYADALEVFDTLNEWVGMSKAYNRMADVHRKRAEQCTRCTWNTASERRCGDVSCLERGRKCYQQAKEVIGSDESVTEYSRHGVIRNLAHSEKGLGVISIRKENYEQARAHLYKAKSYTEDIGYDHGLSNVYNDLGLLYKNLFEAQNLGKPVDQLDRSKNYYQQALQIARHFGFHHHRAFIHYNLGELAGLRGDRETYLREYTSSLVLFLSESNFLEAEDALRKISRPDETLHNNWNWNHSLRLDIDDAVMHVGETVSESIVRSRFAFLLAQLDLELVPQSAESVYDRVYEQLHLSISKFPRDSTDVANDLYEQSMKMVARNPEKFLRGSIIVLHWLCRSRSNQFLTGAKGCIDAGLALSVFYGSADEEQLVKTNSQEYPHNKTLSGLKRVFGCTCTADNRTGKSDSSKSASPLSEIEQALQKLDSTDPETIDFPEPAKVEWMSEEFV